MKIELSKRNQYAAGVFVVLLVAAFALGGDPEGIAPEATPPELEQVDPTTLGRIVITREAGAESIELTFVETAWTVTKPVAYPANKKMVDTMLEKLSTLHVLSVEAETNVHHADMLVTLETGVKVELFDQSGAVKTAFIIGKSVKGATLLRKADADLVYKVEGTIRFNFDKPARDWRDKAILPAFTKDDVIAVRLEHAESTKPIAPTPPTPGTAAPASAPASAPAPETIPPETVMAVKDDAGTWALEEPLGATIEGAKIDQLVQALATVQAFDFADGVPAASAGLETPLLVVTVTMKPPEGSSRGEAHTLLVGSLVGDEYYVGLPGSAQVFKVKKYTVDRFKKRAEDLKPGAAPKPGMGMPPGMPGMPPGMPPGMHALPKGMPFPPGARPAPPPAP